MNIYDFSVKDPNGNDVSLDIYKGKVLLVVNTATGCGFTPQYEGLEKLYQTYKNQGFEILDFPCNQFGHQAPGTDEEIGQFCSLKYNTTFHRFKKIDVNGENAEPLYKWLKERQKGIISNAIKWNFTKFLINREGNVVARYGSITTPQKLETDIKKLL